VGGHDTVLKEVTVRDLSNAYCSVADIYLTDAWFAEIFLFSFQCR